MRSTWTSSSKLVFPAKVRPFDDDDFAARGFAKGYVGPQGFDDDVQVFADLTVRGGNDWVTGSNRSDRHVTGANVGRDFRVDRWEDLVEFREGDRCPIDGARCGSRGAIVLGHIYQLGTRYSAPLDATFVDEDDVDEAVRDGQLRHRDHADHGDGGRAAGTTTTG